MYFYSIHSSEKEESYLYHFMYLQGQKIHICKDKNLKNYSIQSKIM